MLHATLFPDTAPLLAAGAVLALLATAAPALASPVGPAPPATLQGFLPDP